ncbi:MAG TPA: glycosyltransferase family 9 protein [Puia sp.]|nr:glycosyltransferase family 9 protein [Puia sp.]
MSFKEQVVDPFKLFCYQTVYYAVKCIPARRRNARLLLVKSDEIGDYILIRSCLGAFRRSVAYAGHHITFLGNVSCRQLFETYDSGIADEAIWLDKKRFSRNLFYRFHFLMRLRQAGFSDAINLIYSRSWRTDDQLVAVSTAANTVAMQTTDLPISPLERTLTPAHLYTRLETAGAETLFDAGRNSRFIHGLLDMPPEPVTTRLTVGAPPAGLSLPRTYFVIVPGSGHRDKRWPTENFAATARQLTRQYGLTPVICGSPADRQETLALHAVLGEQSLDLTGRTSLVDLLAVLKGAHCLISVDTGAVHLAAAVGCTVFGLFSGFHYGRFAPYPEAMTSRFFAIYPGETEEKIRSGRLAARDVPVGEMAKIPVEKVLRVITKNWIN